MIDRLRSKQIVLLGIGHTNAHVVRMWGMKPIDDADLTCISDYSIATYSGMLPAVLAGQVPQRQMQIDLVRLCSSVGARLITDRVTSIDHARRQLQFESRPPVPFDVLSIGIGSVPSVEGVTLDGAALLPIKPMQTFLQRLSSAVQSRAAAEGHAGSHENAPLRVAVVGSGVAGIEILFCLPAMLRKLRVRHSSLHLVTRSRQILPEVGARARSLILKEIQQRGVSLSTGHAVVRIAPRRVELDDGTNLDADLVIWATGATSPESLKTLGLPLDDRGFIKTDASLQSISGQPIFAVGDTGAIADQHLPKAGVYAVRQGPVLWKNIRRVLGGEPLVDYVPQKSFLKLINLGDGRAAGQWHGLVFSGRWVMRLKDYIDSTFMEKYRPQSMNGGDEPMQCRGCGCKLGADILESALRADGSDVSGLAAGGRLTLDDAAEIGGDPAGPLVASTDFFSSPFDDAFLSGRVAALHSASDLVATGAAVTHALANVVLPEGEGRTQQRFLSDLLAGARLEFQAMGAEVVGGHTIVGPRAEVGFTVVGKPLGGSLICKENLRVGDQLVLTKPLGVGVLLAAHMRARCDADHFQALMTTMLSRQHEIARIATELQIDAGTDVTGFGLAGHLLEMLSASHVSATLKLSEVPLLAGAASALADGIESSLAPANRSASAKISISEDKRQTACYQALFDPQTCGGLLLGIPPGAVDPFLSAVAAAGLTKPSRIGEIQPWRDGDRPLAAE